tara:strand:+ start:3351 stop:5735 length:2385 start_codon:yes stop_codon:yes gene_type:complete
MSYYNENDNYNDKPVLILGSGAREVAVVRCLLKWNQNLKIYYASNIKNHQLDSYCENFIGINEIETILENTNILFKYVFIGPEKYLGSRYNTLFSKYNIPVIGPNNSSLLELSKIYTRNLISNIWQSFNPKFVIINHKIGSEEELVNILNFYNIVSDINNDVDVNNDLSSNYESFGNNSKKRKISHSDDNNFKQISFVIKPDGLTGGKGVKIFPDNFNNINLALDYMNSLDSYLIEERCYGEEFSYMAFVDGKTCKFMPPVQDYKRAYNNNLGPNTGSMGSICEPNLYFLNDNDLNICQRLMNKTIESVNCDIEIYSGILYGSFMKTTDGTIKLIEYNCRFGDPEVINILSLLNTSLDDIFLSIIYQRLNECEINWLNESNYLVYLVPNDYPNVNMLESQNKNAMNYPEIGLTIDDNMYLANLNYINKYNEYSIFKIGKSRSLAILFQDNCLTNCDTQFNRYIRNKQELILALRYRNDMCQLYLSNKKKFKKLSYSTDGVNTEFVGDVLNNNKQKILSTYNSNVLSEFGEFGGNFKLDDNILVASTDGVGTKSILLSNIFGPEGLKIAGEDLVNHNINDILVNGATPLFFLNYYGCYELNESEFSYFISGVTQACKRYNIPLLGGETAVMKDIYRNNTLDLVGTIIGTKKYNFTNDYEYGDILIGIPSSGFHTNGFTLIRKMYDDSLLEGIKTPHRCYLELINDMINVNVEIKGISHITGGGYYDNLNRVITKKYQLYDFELPEYYNHILKYMTKEECIKTFNCGYGLVVIVNKKYFDQINNLEPNCIVIGHIE